MGCDEFLHQIGGPRRVVTIEHHTRFAGGRPGKGELDAVADICGQSSVSIRGVGLPAPAIGSTNSTEGIRAMKVPGAQRSHQSAKAVDPAVTTGSNGETRLM